MTWVDIEGSLDEVLTRILSTECHRTAESSWHSDTLTYSYGSTSVCMAGDLSSGKQSLYKSTVTFSNTSANQSAPIPSLCCKSIAQQQQAPRMSFPWIKSAMLNCADAVLQSNAFHCIVYYAMWTILWLCATLWPYFITPVSWHCSISHPGKTMFSLGEIGVMGVCFHWSFLHMIMCV